MSQLSKTYNPQDIEGKWYAYWNEKGYFHSEPDNREAYSIVIPPPNVTGILHMGHMLNNTIQDILIRRARLMGKNACWVPGTDHASIATEAKVVKWLREEKGLKKSDLSRDEFMKYAWEWTEKYGGIILNQLQRLGASCDWQRTAFTMDEVRSKGVIKAFVDLYNRGKIYRGLRMINWDPQAQTVLSNEEVIYGEENARLYKLRYVRTDDPGKALVISTQRPETIMADTAIAVHPDDERYRDWVGKKVLIPLINKEIPVIADDYVDIEFGTGALKVTPAHDINDYELGKKHNLEIIDILNDDGTLNEKATILIGQDRFEARKNIITLLEEACLLEGTIDYRTNIGRSERTNAVVEPKLSLQWFVDMKALAGPALKAVNDGDINFYPKNQVNTYNHWLENIRDWCISRQLWWGHRIPAYYYADDVFVAASREEAESLAKAKIGADFDAAKLRQDEDALDTWFSSWLWPITVFDGFSDGKDYGYYVPTSVLVTGWDIIFLWVARMIMAGYEWKEERPFKDVYFTGMVRDKQRRKMSKSLGNSPDALGLIDMYGADGVRFGMMSSSPAGGDLLFDEKLCEQGRNFCNKIWNALRLITSWEVSDTSDASVRNKNKLACDFMRQRISEVQTQTEANFDAYRLSENLILIYSLIWDDFCAYYLEMIKPTYGQPVDRETLVEANALFADLMIILHPFMPFISEEVYQQVKMKDMPDCIVARYPTPAFKNDVMVEGFAFFKDFVSLIRDIRNRNGLKQRDILPVYPEGDISSYLSLSGYRELMESIAYVELRSEDNLDAERSVTSLLRTVKIFVELPHVAGNKAEAQAEILEKIKYFEGFVASINKKLENQRFVENAPAEVIEKERKKLADSLASIEALKKELK
ncbi:MAG TPA: valine--tRNA ligase [Saprospiraceae bacterium]|nr:valine--tRNA ligase [Saprospiraceae bacterium]